MQKPRLFVGNSHHFQIIRAPKLTWQFKNQALGALLNWYQRWIDVWADAVLPPKHNLTWHCLQKCFFLHASNLEYSNQQVNQDGGVCSVPNQGVGWKAQHTSNWITNQMSVNRAYRPRKFSLMASNPKRRGIWQSAQLVAHICCPRQR